MESRAAPRQRAKLEQMTSACACLNARRLARLLTQLYDDALRPVGIRSTQLPILATLGWRGVATLTELADAVVMDRTTLTRSLTPLVRRRWVRSVAGPDRRTRQVGLTRAGWAVVRRSTPLWEGAQARVRHLVGEAAARRLLRSFVGAVDQMKGGRGSRQAPGLDER